MFNINRIIRVNCLIFLIIILTPAFFTGCEEKNKKPNYNLTVNAKNNTQQNNKNSENNDKNNSNNKISCSDITCSDHGICNETESGIICKCRDRHFKHNIRK